MFPNSNLTIHSAQITNYSITVDICYILRDLNTERVAEQKSGANYWIINLTQRMSSMAISNNEVLEKKFV